MVLLPWLIHFTKSLLGLFFVTARIYVVVIVVVNSILHYDKLLKAAAVVSVDVCEGIIESDDIASLTLEIEKSLNYCKKCNLLVESVKRKDTLVHIYKSCT